MQNKTIENVPLFNYPTHQLTDTEINDPYLVIEDFFSFAYLPDVRVMLCQSFKATITGNYPKELDRLERNDVVCLYEYMQKLVEASHLINEKRKLKMSNKPVTTKENQEQVFHGK